jgi:chromosome segregation and condensation protein ScpB
MEQRQVLEAIFFAANKPLPNRDGLISVAFPEQFINLCFA